MTTAVNSPSYEVEIRERTDRQVLFILLAHIPVVGLLVPMGYGTTTFALVASLLVGGIAAAGYFTMRGTRALSSLFAVCLMLFSAIMIQAQMGRIEMHFHIFAALALVIIYRDWLPVVVAAGTIAVHHLAFYVLQMQEAGVWLAQGVTFGLVMVHAGYVIIEAGVLVYLARMSFNEAREGEVMGQTVARMIGDGSGVDLTCRANMRSPMLDSFNALLDTLENMVSGLSASMQQLGQLGSSVSKGASDLRQGSEQQQDKTRYMVQAMLELSQATADVARNAADAARASALRCARASASPPRERSCARRVEHHTLVQRFRPTTTPRRDQPRKGRH